MMLYEPIAKRRQMMHLSLKYSILKTMCVNVVMLSNVKLRSSLKQR